MILPRGLRSGQIGALLDFESIKIKVKVGPIAINEYNLKLLNNIFYESPKKHKRNRSLRRRACMDSFIRQNLFIAKVPMAAAAGPDFAASDHNPLLLLLLLLGQKDLFLLFLILINFILIYM